MNGRNNEVIMCVYQGLSGSSYTGGRAQSQSLLLLLPCAHPGLFVLTLHRYNWFSRGLNRTKIEISPGSSGCHHARERHASLNGKKH